AAALLVALGVLGWVTTAAAQEESLKGDSMAVEGATPTPLELDVKSLLPRLTRADEKGTALFACDGNGVLRRISYPDLKVTKKKDFQRKVAWIALTAEGLLLTMPDPPEAWLLDPDSWEVKTKIAVPALKRAVGAPATSFGAAFGGDQADNRLYLLDLKAGKAVPFVAPDTVKRIDLGNFDPVMTPDGKYVF